MAHLRSIPVFYYTEKGISWIVDGYVPTSAENSKFDFGPINTTISGNSFEGARFRVGGMTTGHLNPHWFFSGYAAYGTKDGEFKYKGQVEYSFNKKKVHANEFPINSIRASYIYDIDQLGQHYFTNKDNIVLSLKRKSDNRITYLRKGEISYQREHENGFSYALGVRHRTEYSTYCVPFQTFLPDNLVRDLSSYNMTEAEIKLRYAPGEKFYQMKARRELITHNIPIFTLTHITAKKGFLNTDYNFNRTDFSVQKRIWLSAFGYINAQASAGIVWDKVPFTMLAIPNANLSYTIQPGTYSLMNAVEFINDRYVSWDLDYHLYGLILNRIPLIKMLKWREVVNFKGLYGTLSNKNIPTDENGLFILPNGTYEMGKTP